MVNTNTAYLSSLPGILKSVTIFFVIISISCGGHAYENSFYNIAYNFNKFIRWLPLSELPGLGRERFFLAITGMTLTISFISLVAHSMNAGLQYDRGYQLIDIGYHVLAAILLITAGSLIIASARKIDKDGCDKDWNVVFPTTPYEPPPTGFTTTTTTTTTTTLAPPTSTSGPISPSSTTDAEWTTESDEPSSTPSSASSSPTPISSTLHEGETEPPTSTVEAESSSTARATTSEITDQPSTEESTYTTTEDDIPASSTTTTPPPDPRIPEEEFQMLGIAQFMADLRSGDFGIQPLLMNLEAENGRTRAQNMRSATQRLIMKVEATVERTRGLRRRATMVNAFPSRPVIMIMMVRVAAAVSKALENLKY